MKWIIAGFFAAASASAAHGEILSIKQMSIDAGHACALLSNNGVKCWGYNAQGQLGLGDVEPRGMTPESMGDALPYVDLGTDKEVRSANAFGFGTCVIFMDGTAKCWGE